MNLEGGDGKSTRWLDALDRGPQIKVNVNLDFLGLLAFVAYLLTLYR